MESNIISESGKVGGVIGNVFKSSIFQKGLVVLIVIAVIMIAIYYSTYGIWSMGFGCDNWGGALAFAIFAGFLGAGMAAFLMHKFMKAKCGVKLLSDATSESP